MAEMDRPAPDSDAAVLDWVTENIGGRVQSWARQPRWRPMWFIDLETDSGMERVLVRGESTDVPLIFPLEHEMLVQRVMEEHGVPVPHVYGWCDKPRAFAIYNGAGATDFVGSATTSAIVSSTSISKRWRSSISYRSSRSSLPGLSTGPRRPTRLMSGSAGSYATTGRSRYGRIP